MADNGHITTIKELGRYSIPGGGINENGQAVNNKVLVWGQLFGLYLSTGLDLNLRGGLRAFGVSTADFFSFTVRTAGATGTANPGSLTGFLAHLQQTDTPGKIFVIDEVGAANPAEPSNGDDITIDWIAIGDDARAPILT